MPYLIMLDSGHGGNDPGAVYNGRQEKDDTLRLMLTVGELLQENAIDVLYTRTTDLYISPYERATEANRAGADLFISIHRNSYPTDNEVMGVESLVYNLSGTKAIMAENINTELENIGFKNLGVKVRPNLVVLKWTKMPAILIEVGFINSDTDNQIFDQNFQAIAEAITQGILKTLRDTPELTDAMYHVQTGLFRKENNARYLLNALLEQGFPAYMDTWKDYMRVYVGNYIRLDDAAEVERQLDRLGYDTLIITSK